MKTKRKLLPKSIPTAGDSTIDFSAAVDHISNVNSNVSTKKQHLCSSNSVLSVAAVVGPSGVDNIVPVDANVVSYPPTSHSFPMSRNVDANILANTGTSQLGPTLEGCRTTSVVGAIVYETGPDNDMDYDIMLETRSSYPQRVNKLHASYMSLQFPLLFIYREDGYSKDLKMVGSSRSSSKDKCLTMLAYYSYYLHDRANRYNYLSRTEKLFQQYVVTALYAIEQNSIDYIREHQNDIRNNYLSGIYDAINRGDNDASHCVLYAVEFQKRGLPHCHTLLWIDESVRVRRDEDIDNYVSVELLFQDIDPEGYRVVSELMMHGPCGLANPSAVYGKYWRHRRISTKSSIGRLTYVHHASGDLFYERMLPCHQKGWTSFPGIRTVNDIIHSMCREVCEALGLLENAQELEITLEEAKLTAISVELRLHIDDSELKDYVLYEFEGCLNHCSKSVTDFGLRTPPEHLMSVLRNRLLMEENSYDRELIAVERYQLLPIQMARTSDPHNMAATKGKIITNEPKVSDIVGLNPGDSNKIIEAIVYHKWVSKHIQTQQPIRMCCILMDKQGTPNQANMDAKDTGYFDQLLELHAAYRITDYIGYVQGVIEFRTSGNVTSNQIHRRIIDIQNLRLTLWHDMALNFNLKEYEAMEKPIVIAVISCIQLSGTSATHYYLNPNLPETYHIKEYDIKTWNKKRTRTASPFPLSSKLIPKTTSYCFKAIIGDGSGTISLTCFNNQANSLTRDCTEVLAELPDKNPYQLPPNLKNLEDKVFKDTVLPLPAPPIQHALPEPTFIEQPEPILLAKPMSPALSTTAGNELILQQDIISSSQQSPTKTPESVHPAKNQPEETPIDFVPFTAPQENPHNPEHTDTLQSTLPQIQNTIEIQKSIQPVHPARPSA
uniref:DNA helicase n=1 Tax=Tanacetum cinerariifolium TaxID=118510 RepID=A0A6L2MWQ4_TANCI|nr:DNA helicase [Tanacetum cinerariifolium]